jgi:nucleoside phosphorylase
MNLDAIFVPQSAEYQAVCRGLRNLDRSPVIIALPIGPQAVTRHLRTTLANTLAVTHIRRAIVVGLAGSLAPQHGVGDIVLYRSLCTFRGEELQQEFCDADLTEALSKKLSTASVKQVVAFTSDRVIHDPQEKAQLAQQSGATVVDMEGMAILSILQAENIAVSMVRVISDDCHARLPDISPAIATDGSLQGMALARIMMRQPIASFHLVRGSLRALTVLERLVPMMFK